MNVLHQITHLHNTPPISKIICVKNARAKVFCKLDNLFLEIENHAEKYEKDHGSRLGVASHF